MVVQLKGHGSGAWKWNARNGGKYFHSNHGQGRGMSWGGSNQGVAWKLEWSGKLATGSDIQLFGKGRRKYWYSNSPEKKGMSWGGSNNDRGWKIFWDGALRTGTQVNLLGKGTLDRKPGKYFASNHGEGVGMSWGGKSSKHNWELSWDSGCGFGEQAR